MTRRQFNSWFSDNWRAFFFQSWQGNNTTGSWTSYSCEVTNKKQFNTQPFYILKRGKTRKKSASRLSVLSRTKRVKSRAKVCSQVYTHVERRKNKRAILSAGNHATVLATEIQTFPNATNATASSEKKGLNLIQPGKQCNIVAELKSAGNCVARQNKKRVFCGLVQGNSPVCFSFT